MLKLPAASWRLLRVLPASLWCRDGTVPCFLASSALKRALDAKKHSVENDTHHLAIHSTYRADVRWFYVLQITKKKSNLLLNFGGKKQMKKPLFFFFFNFLVCPVVHVKEKFSARWIRCRRMHRLPLCKAGFTRACAVCVRGTERQRAPSALVIRSVTPQYLSRP